MRIGWAAALALCAVLPAAKFSAELAVLDRDRDPARLEAAAIRIAASGDAEAVAGLAKRLGDRSCLRRLDPQDSGQSVVRLGRVFETLAQHPSPAVESLCLTLARDAEFTAVPARLNFLLNALAAVRPMSQPAADVFRTTGRTGYLEVNGPLLSGNASPRAFEVLGELLGDGSLDAARRASMAHWALLPTRTGPEVVATCARVLARQGLAHEVQIAILESLFDYQPRKWFGVRTEQPRPPSWQSAPPRTRELLESLAAAALARPDLEPAIRQAIENTLRELR